MDTLLLALADSAADAAIDEAKAELIQQVALAVISLLGMVITGFITYASNAVRKWIKAKAAETESKAHLAAFTCATTKLETISKNAVEEVEQTLVRQLKEADKWDAAGAKRARDTAVKIALKHLGSQGLQELKACMGHAPDVIEGMLRTYVERTVRAHGTTKTPGSPVVPLDGDDDQPGDAEDGAG